MSGIANYFHGEGGEVVDFGWVADEELLSFEMRLAGDPHREIARDYASDITIDAALKPGDRAVYVRLNRYCGVWVRDGEQFSPQVEQAVERTEGRRRLIHQYIDKLDQGFEAARSWAESTVPTSTGVPVQVRDTAEAHSERPATAVSIFLSYSSRNALMARQFFERLREDAKADVWFDLTQPGKSPAHDAQIERWLEGAIHECEVFLLLLTHASARSNWVRKEINAAVEKGGRWGKNSHLVCLNLEGVDLPDDLPRDYVVDCRGLAIGEILEELYAAVYKRTGRVKWLEEQHRRGWREQERHGLTGYDHLISDGGVAKELSFSRGGGHLRWTLEYTARAPDGREVVGHAKGSDENAIVDLGIRPGDRVGFFMLNLLNDQQPLWMRSADLSLDPFDVYRVYRRKLESPTSAVRVCNILLALFGLLVVAAISGGGFALLQNAFTGEPPPGVSQELTGAVAHWMRILITANIAVYGLYQLVSHAHPHQFKSRDLKSAVNYSVKALAVTAGVPLAHTLTYGFVLVIGYVFTVGIVISIIASVSGSEPMGAVVQGLGVVYGGWVAYGAFRLLKLFRESPDYIHTPQFSWF